MWVPIAHACELATPGDYIVLPWLPAEEVAVTNIDGLLVAFDNRCQHRGARIFTESRGNRPPVCGYHGRCARISQLRTFAVTTLSGFVWVSRSVVGTPDPGESLAGFFEAAGPALSLHSTLRFTMDCDWRVAIDNTLDLEHVEHVHATSLAKLKLSRLDLVGDVDGSSVEVFASGTPALRHIGNAIKMPAGFDYIHAHVFPRTCLSSTGGWTWSLQHYFPRADGRTEFVHRLYVRPGVPAWLADGAAKLNEQVFREDVAICAGVPAHFKADYGPRDDRIRNFRSRL